MEGTLVSASHPDAVFAVLSDFDTVADVFGSILESQTARDGDNIHLTQARAPVPEYIYPPAFSRSLSAGHPACGGALQEEGRLRQFVGCSRLRLSLHLIGSSSAATHGSILTVLVDLDLVLLWP